MTSVSLSIWFLSSIASIAWYCVIRHRWHCDHGQFGTSSLQFVWDLIFLALIGPIGLIMMGGFEDYLKG